MTRSNRTRYQGRFWRPERLLEPGRRFQVTAAVGLLLLLAATTVLVYFTGGTSLAYPYFTLIPIVLAAAVFGTPGGFLLGLLAGLALGPFMPLDVDAGIRQTTANWLIRAATYVTLGVVTGWLFNQLREHMRQLRRQAFTSDATGLPNRQALESAIREYVGRISDDDTHRAYLVVVKLENVRESATSLGFSFERMLLASVAERLVQEVGGGRHEVYHIGEDQFAVLLTDATRRDCFQATRRMLQALERPFQIRGLPVYLEAHFGVAAYPAHERQRLEQLLPKALVAVDSAIREGRRYRSYDRRLDERSAASLSLLGQLPRAIEEHQLELHYQPKLNLVTGEVQGVEALVRWRHPNLGLIPPGEFLPQAEQTGLVHPLTRWVLDTALTDLRQLHQRQPQLQVSVNVSARNFLDTRFCEHVLTVFATADIPAHLLELELTESAIMADPGEVSRQLERLAEAGLGVAVDDFGTGYSSMVYLKQLPVSALKIDRMFIKDMCTQQPTARIIEASIALAHTLQMHSIAEGVEDQATLRSLQAAGCQYAQGFLIARPMPMPELQAWLADETVQQSLRQLVTGQEAGSRQRSGHGPGN